MKTCPNCKIRVGGAPAYCPLCQSQLLGEPEAPLWPRVMPETRSFTLFYKIFAFLLLSAALISVAVDYWFGWLGWSVVVVVCVAAFLFTLRVAMRTYQSVPRLLFQLLLAVSIVTVICDFYTGWDGFSLRWVAPILCSVTLILNFILSFVKRGFAENGLVYLLMNILLGAVPYLGVWLLWEETPVAWVVCLLISAITFLGLVVFQGRTLGRELHRRLHL